MLLLGIMTGTSLDAYDIALVKIKIDKKHTKKNLQIKLLKFISLSLPPQFKEQIQSINLKQKICLKQFASLNKNYTKYLAVELKKISQLKKYYSQIRAIGISGQTIYHNPSLGISMTIGIPELLAKLTKINVVSDFRMGDIALGGQGAPLAPELHRILGQELGLRIFINLGGIANISIINSNNEIICGFDTGPANCLVDEITIIYFQQEYDLNGNLAKQGKLDEDILNKLMKDSYFSKPVPKSTGRDKFNYNWLTKIIGKTNMEKINKYDLLATLVELTASTIATQIKAILAKELLHSTIPLILVGGGAKNSYLKNRILFNLNNKKNKHANTSFIAINLKTIGLNSQTIESMLMAWLAYKRIKNIKTDLRAVTGSSYPAIIGGLWSGE